MSSVIQAALIGAGASALVAIVAFLATRSVTRMQLAAARDDRLWDKRAAAYTEILAAIGYRKTQREPDARVHGTHEGSQQESGGSYPPPDWPSLDARLLALAAEPVVTAMRAACIAHQRAIEALDSWHTAPGDVALRSAAQDACGAANAADDKLTGLIRTDLQGKGTQLPESPSDSASR